MKIKKIPEKRKSEISIIDECDFCGMPTENLVMINFIPCNEWSVETSDLVCRPCATEDAALKRETNRRILDNV